jgi:hypothetical protein
VREICCGTKYQRTGLPLRRERRVPPFSSVDYRRYAAECVRLAQRIEDPLDKARLLDMAETFRELAEKNKEPGHTEG